MDRLLIRIENSVLDWARLAAVAIDLVYAPASEAYCAKKKNNLFVK